MSRASVLDTLRVAGVVLAPMIARGAIIRRPPMVALGERLDVDRRAGAVLAGLRHRYGPAPLLMRIPGRDLAVVLDPADVERILDGSPRPFTPANREKRAALRHFEPTGVLISDEPERAVRRPYNEQVLDAHRITHRLHDHVVAVVREEVATLDGREALTWDGFAEAFWRVVRRVALGEHARDDERLTDLMVLLRAQANWAFLRPRSERRLAELTRLLHQHVDHADPLSLAGIVRATPAGPGVDAVGQMPQWLFAFDAAGIATFRALALLAGHPGSMRQVRTQDPAAARGLRPAARGAVLESLRLWPTTLVILRDSVEETAWRGGSRIPAGTGFVVVSSFFHRDETRLPWADRYAPEIWSDGRAEGSRALVPFSAGPVRCPGRTLVLDLTSELLAALVARFDVTQSGGRRLGADVPLPRTLANTRLRFEVRARARP